MEPVQPAQPADALLRFIGKAIARAEGYGPAGNIPTDAHNPGDLMLGKRFDITVTHKGQQCTGTINGVTIYPKADPDCDIDDLEDGWGALYREIRLMLTGRSHIYQAGWTITRISEAYTHTDPEAWAATVAEALGVTPETPLNQVQISVSA